MMIRGRVRATAATIGLTIAAAMAACEEPEATAPLPATVQVEQAVHDELLFELDGNPHDDVAVVGDDWGTPTVLSDPDIPTVDPLGATIFTGGGSKDNQDISNWQHTSGSVPDKDELMNAAAMTYTNGQDELILYFAADRHARNGDAAIGFWFLQDEVVVNEETGTFTDAAGNPAHHKDGDILVLSQFTNGGAVGTIEVCHWVGDGEAGHLECEAVAVGPVAGYPNVSCTSDDIACAAVNPGTITSVWPFDPKTGADDTYAQGAFFEGGVNATELLGETPCFATFLVETRSSQSVDAVLKDFVRGNLDVCQPSVDVCKQCDVALVDTGSQLVLQVNYSGLACNTGNIDLVVDLTDDVDGTILDDVTIAAGTCMSFSGNYQPSSTTSTDPNLVSFTDTVTMTGVHGQAGTVSDTATATCGVCGTDTTCPTSPPFP